MSVESALYSAITTDPDMSALIGTRLYPGVVPQTATLPAAAYLVISEELVGSNGCVTSRIQVSLFATTYAQTVQLRDALVALANSRRDWNFFVGPDLYEDDTAVYHKPVDIEITHEVN